MHKPNKFNFSPIDQQLKPKMISSFHHCLLSLLLFNMNFCLPCSRQHYPHCLLPLSLLHVSCCIRPRYSCCLFIYYTYLFLCIVFMYLWVPSLLIQMACSVCAVDKAILPNGRVCQAVLLRSDFSSRS